MHDLLDMLYPDPQVFEGIIDSLSEDIQITKDGVPVAVIMNYDNYIEVKNNLIIMTDELNKYLEARS